MIYKNSKWVWESNDWHSNIRRQVTPSGLVATTSNKALFVDWAGSYFTTLHMVYSILNILRSEQFYHFWSSISVSDFHKLKQQHIHIKCGHALLLLKTFLCISSHFRTPFKFSQQSMPLDSTSMLHLHPALSVPYNKPMSSKKAI